MKICFVTLFIIALASCAFGQSSDETFVDMEPKIPEFLPEARITNGRAVSINDYPYQVGLNVNGGWCGGSLISPTYILTAAHCVDGIGAGSIFAFLGSVIKQAGVRRTAKRTIVHPNWNRNSLLNDIALIQIDAIGYTNTIRPVALPNIFNTYSTYIDNSVIATGWGKTSDSSSSGANYLQGATLTVIDNNVCASTYGSHINPSNVCVSTLGGISTCSGDSGGPLVLQSNKVLIGLTSFGASAGCTAGLPSAFTRISSYRQWIKDIAGV
ncbi:brachyurin-like [Episyrphus balteatus]|uniref:brachyurin-like n=1 Tax=Episyrphus balteatus TaxID=286459 RepID=UPI002485E5A1|nr:brachyurin-like [Episyrphus balteatus]